jgi:hypothetical protein
VDFSSDRNNLCPPRTIFVRLLLFLSASYHFCLRPTISVCVLLVLSASYYFCLRPTISVRLPVFCPPSTVLSPSYCFVCPLLFLSASYYFYPPPNKHSICLLLNILSAPYYLCLLLNIQSAFYYSCPPPTILSATTCCLFLSATKSFGCYQTFCLHPSISVRLLLFLSATKHFVCHRLIHCTSSRCYTISRSYSDVLNNEIPMACERLRWVHSSII